MTTKKAHQQPQPGEIRHAEIPLEQLRPHSRNYRKHPEAQIKRLQASLQRFGQVRSIVVQEGAGGRYLIVAGHGLVEAAQGLDWKNPIHADIIPPTWTSEQVEGYLIADNESSRLADDDLVQLAAMLEEQANAGYNLESLGYNKDELEELLEELAKEALGDGQRDVDDPAGGGDDFDAEPDESGPTRTQPGDLWILGGYTVCPSCRSKNPIGGEGRAAMAKSAGDDD